MYPAAERGEATMRQPPEVLTAGEADAILAAANRRAATGLRNRCMLELMYRAGLRVSEVTGLRPRDVRLTGDRPRVEVRGSKGGKGRNVPLRPSTVVLLERWQQARPESAWFFCTTCTRTGRASGNPPGARLSARYAQQMVKRYALRAGVDRAATPHTFRHTYATQMLDAGFTIREVQVLLGHSHVNTTMVYTHVSHDALADKVAVLG